MRSLSYIVLLSSQAILLGGCPKNEGTTTTADAAASATPAASLSQVTLAPLDTSASAAATAMTATATAMTATATPTVIVAHGDAAAKPTGSTATTASPSTQAQFKQCCAALHKQSQQQTPQAAQLAQAAGICDGLVATMATAPMPQMDQVKGLLAGVQLPPVCQGL